LSHSRIKPKNKFYHRGELFASYKGAKPLQYRAAQEGGRRTDWRKGKGKGREGRQGFKKRNSLDSYLWGREQVVKHTLDQF